MYSIIDETCDTDTYIEYNKVYTVYKNNILYIRVIYYTQEWYNYYVQIKLCTV